MLIITEPILEKIQEYFKTNRIKSSNPFPLNQYPHDYTRPAFDPEIYENWEEKYNT